MEWLLPVGLGIAGLIVIILVVRFIMGCLPKVLIFFVIVILIAAALVYFFYLRGRYLP
jgi:hypothetical protein